MSVVCLWLLIVCFPECGNNLCEQGERCLDSSCVTGCVQDCPFPVISCPSANSDVCSGNGMCLVSSGSCSCFPGYAGSTCNACRAGFLHNIAGNCVAIALPTCSDRIMNGNETGIDCGGACRSTCPSGNDSGNASLSPKPTPWVIVSGALIGGVVLILGVVIAVLWSHRKRRHKLDAVTQSIPSERVQPLAVGHELHDDMKTDSPSSPLFEIRSPEVVRASVKPSPQPRQEAIPQPSMHSEPLMAKPTVLSPPPNSLHSVPSSDAPDAAPSPHSISSSRRSSRDVARVSTLNSPLRRRRLVPTSPPSSSPQPPVSHPDSPVLPPIDTVLPDRVHGGRPDWLEPSPTRSPPRYTFTAEDVAVDAIAHDVLSRYVLKALPAVVYPHIVTATVCAVPRLQCTSRKRR